MCDYFFKIFLTNLSNKTDGQTLDMDTHDCTCFGAEVVTTYILLPYSGNGSTVKLRVPRVLLFFRIELPCKCHVR